MGMWFIIDDNDWIEFRRDKKYDFGHLPLFLPLLFPVKIPAEVWED